MNIFGQSPKLKEALKAYAPSPNADYIRRMLEQGVNSTNEAGNTPLIEASYNGFTGLVSALLEEGADPSVQAKDGSTALTWAVLKGHSETAGLLFSALALQEAERKKKAKK